MERSPGQRGWGERLKRVGAWMLEQCAHLDIGLMGTAGVPCVVPATAQAEQPALPEDVQQGVTLLGDDERLAALVQQWGEELR